MISERVNLRALIELLLARVAREWPMVEERAAGGRLLGRKNGLVLVVVGPITRRHGRNAETSRPLIWGLVLRMSVQ